MYRKLDPTGISHMLKFAPIPLYSDVIHKSIITTFCTIFCLDITLYTRYECILRQNGSEIMCSSYEPVRRDELVV